MTAPESAPTPRRWPSRLLSLSWPSAPEHAEAPEDHGAGADHGQAGLEAPGMAHETTGTGMIDTNAEPELTAREIPMDDDAWRRETSTSEHAATASSPFSRMSHSATRDPQPLSQVPGPANTGTFTRESVEQAYQTVFGALRSYPDRYLDGLRAAAQVSLGPIRQAADDDVTAIEALRTRRHAEVDAEASSAIAARQATLQLELADATGRLEGEISRARTEIAEYEAQLAGFQAKTAAFLQRTASPAGWSAPAPLAPIAVAPVEAAEAAPAGSHAETAAEPPPALEFTPEPEPEVAAHFAPEPEAEPVADATVAEIEPVQAEAAEPVKALVSTESPEAPNAAAESIATVETQVEAVEADVAAAVIEPEMDADEPIASLEPQVLKTTIAVRGLADVASIAAFMRLLTRASGIGSVQVRTEGPGEVFFAVSHDPDADLTRLVRSLWPFEVRVLEAQPGSMTVATRDPYAA